jgi:predicted RNase H-like HicB family nuclease
MQGSRYPIHEVMAMKYRAIIKKVNDWWIGWIVDLPGINAQEKTKARLIESLRIGAEEMLAVEVPFESEALMTTINVPDPQWADTSNG